MNAAARIGAFAVALAVIFGVATAVGGVLGVSGATAAHPEPDDAASPNATMAGMSGGDHGPSAADGPRGLATADGALRLVLDRTTFAPGRTSNVHVEIVDTHDRVVRDFDVEHTKRLHLITVRRDLTRYEHRHPVQTADGSWSLVASRD